MYELYDVKAAIKRLQEKKSHLENRIKESIGENEGIWSDWGKVTWRLGKGRSSVDIKRLREESPELAEKFTKVSEPARIFRATITGR